MTDTDALVDRIRRGDRRSLARAMTQIAGDGPAARALQDRARAASGNTPWWGFTGPPGVGKSTLIDRLLDRLRERGKRIGVVAIDPSSPIGKGALLGDRVRMMQHAVNEDIFIRSLLSGWRAIPFDRSSCSKMVLSPCPDSIALRKLSISDLMAVIFASISTSSSSNASSSSFNLSTSSPGNFLISASRRSLTNSTTCSFASKTLPP